jgi:tetratricopeptide (TPR) repeat protein
MAFDKRKSLQNALTYTQQGKWDRAIAEYEAILKADPRDLTVCNNLGDLYARAGKAADAIDQYVKLGELYRADGLSVKAIAVYKKIAKLDPSNIAAYQACADLYWEQGLVGEAKIQLMTLVERFAKAGDAPKLIEAYRRLAQFDPGNTAAIAKLADLLMKEGKQEEAAIEYDRASQAAQAAGQTAEAKRLFQKARDLLPQAAEANLGMAEILRGEGKLPEAIEVLEKLTVAEPENAKAWQTLGEVRASLGLGAEAVNALQKATAFGMPEAAVATTLGQALLQTGRADEAVALCERVSDEALTLGEPDQAIACCRGLLAAAPQLTALHAHLATMLQNLGRDEEARAAIRALAVAQESVGEAEAAIETYRRLLALDPTDAEAQARLNALSPDQAPSEDVAISPPLSQEDAAMSIEEPALLLEVPETGPQAEGQDLGHSRPEDLDLSLGEEDVALLLEEPTEPAQETKETQETQEAKDEPNLLVAEEGLGLEIGTEAAGASEAEAKDEPVAAGESVSLPEWMAQEFEPLELESRAPEAGAAQIVWPSGEIPLTLDDAPAGLSAQAEPVQDLTLPADESLLAEFGLPPAVENFPETGEELPSEAAPPSHGMEGAPFTPELLVPEEEDSAGQVAEQLAEAEVYQKYGLEEKARERLLEVLRLAPNNLVAHRGLKAIYRERRQTEEVCAEILSIAKILRRQGSDTEAIREIQEGLALAPGHVALQQLLSGAPEPAAVAPSAMEIAGTPEVLKAGPETPPPVEAPTKEFPAEPEPIAVAEPVVVPKDDEPPPDVRLLLDFEEPASAGPGPIVDLDHALGPAQDDELPSELRALLDDGGEEPTLIVAPGEPGDDDQSMADDVAEADFYLSQGMVEEAKIVLLRMQEGHPRHPAVATLAARILSAAEGPSPPPPTPPALPAPIEPAHPTPVEEPVSAAIAGVLPDDSGGSLQELVPKFTVTDAPTELATEDFVNLGAELEEEMAVEDQLTTAQGSGPLMDGLLKEFQKGVREQLDEKDYETHYNLGIAYKEMELYDEAIEEFRLTAREPKRALESADLAALCHLAKGQPDQAIQDLQAGLLIGGHPPDAYHSLRYDLGTAYEKIGDLGRALEQFEILQSEGARFRDIQTRVQTLRGRVVKPPSPKKADETAPRKKKISFI